MDNQNSVLYIILGSFLALLTSLFVEIYKDWMKNKNNEKDFKITLKLEVKSILETIGKLIETYGQRQCFLFTILTELNGKIQRLDRIRDRVIYIKDDIKKEEILSLFNNVNLYYSDTFTLESLAFPPSSTQNASSLPWDSETYKSQRQILAFRGTDLKRNIQDLVNFLER